MFLPLLLAATLLPPPEVPRALETAVAREGARVEVLAYRPSLPPGCRVSGARARGEVRGSGAVVVDLAGRDGSLRPCAGWALVRARIFAPVLVATRSLSPGDPLTGAVALEERDLPADEAPLSRAPPEAVAAWSIPAGTPITAGRIRAAGPRPGARIPVVVTHRGFTVETSGTLIACGGGRDCALLPSGKRLAGALRDGKLVVEAP